LFFTTKIKMTPNNTHKVLLTAVLGSLALGSHAQTQQGNSLDSVIIRQNRIQTSYDKQNNNIQIMDKAQIATLPVKSVTELLSYIGGVDLRQRGPSGVQADVSIDGSTFDQVLVLINGVKVSDPQTGHNMMNIPLPISAIDHIEVLRGSAARIYGVNALAGAINIVTALPQNNSVFAQAYAGSSFTKDTANGDTYYSRGVQATAGLNTGNQSHLLSLAQDQGNGYRYNTSMESYRLFYQNKIRLNDKNSIEAMGGYVSNYFGAGLFYAAPNDANATEKVQTGLGAISYNWRPNDKLKLTPRISYRYNKDDYIYIKQKPELYHNVHETNVLSGELNASYQTGHGTAGAGVEYRSEEINSNSLGKRQRQNIGFYAEYRHNFSSKLNAGAGIYLNQNSDFGFQAFPAIDAGYRFARNWKVFANASTGQRLPTFTDLYYNGPSNIGNPTLQPELSSYAEGGVQFNHPELDAKAAYFYRHSTDFIDWVRNSDTAKWQPQNFQSVNTQGVSLTLNYQLSRHLSLSDRYQLTLVANYTYLDQQLETPTDKTSKYTIDALRHQCTVSLRSLLFRHVQLNLSSRYQQRISNNDYTILDARVGYQGKNWLVYTDMNNLLDQQYREIGSVPMPGRWFTLGARFTPSWKN
jgi:iron complex outermembrane receptor protein